MTTDLEKRIEQLEAADDTDMVCPDCRGAGFDRQGWCDHRIPPPFDRFAPFCRARERKHDQSTEG